MQVASLVNADSWREIVFTRNASEAVNLVAHAWGTANLKPGDEVSPTHPTHLAQCIGSCRRVPACIKQSTDV